MTANRVAYGQAIHDLAAGHQNIVVVDADLTNVVNYGPFQKDFPERYFECGIAEQNMVSVAAGLASCGFIAFTASFSVFTSMRALDQVRNMACYNNLDVKVIGTHAGIETGQDGGTHQSVEDMAIMRALPNMRVLAPSTPLMTSQLTKVMVDTPGPFYMRFGREPNVELYDETEQFPLGGSKTLREGSDLAIMACGRMVEFSLAAAELLMEKGIAARVIDMYSIKPLDTEAVVRAAKETADIITVEDHSVIGGLGGAVSECVTRHTPCRVDSVGLEDVFGRSGYYMDLFEHFHLTPQAICERAIVLLGR